MTQCIVYQWLGFRCTKCGMSKREFIMRQYQQNCNHDFAVLSPLQLNLGFLNKTYITYYDGVDTYHKCKKCGFRLSA